MDLTSSSKILGILQIVAEDGTELLFCNLILDITRTNPSFTGYVAELGFLISAVNLPRDDDSVGKLLNGSIITSRLEQLNLSFQ
ncbi:hypothetical protein Ahy_A08g040863 isoform B [Arachis hypogaea]|uniref:Uncharacterized protein n=1 Tax=Arachis hypogaea TaxID=3818 RepID=A0A445C0T7_ARAHY|nr:hypothetical protein Ahy_A08g040863 isoform B [Arachis hypogaea]